LEERSDIAVRLNLAQKLLEARAFGSRIKTDVASLADQHIR
jgi:hypothetical protein